MLYTVKEVIKFLSGFKYNIIYQEDSKEFKLKGKTIRLPISKKNLISEYKKIYKEEL